MYCAMVVRTLFLYVMRDVSSQNFGLLMAFILPGFTVVWGVSHVSADVALWLGTTPTEAPTVGGFLYVTIASVAAGLTVSTIRWAIIDPIHHLFGIKQPAWNFSQLATKVTAFTTLIEIHYRFYQWYSNMLIAMPIAFVLRWSKIGFNWTEMVIVVLVEALFFAASRDTISKYYLRVDAILSDR